MNNTTIDTFFVNVYYCTGTRSYLLDDCIDSILIDAGIIDYQSVTKTPSIIEQPISISNNPCIPVTMNTN